MYIRGTNLSEELQDPGGAEGSQSILCIFYLSLRSESRKEFPLLLVFWFIWVTCCLPKGQSSPSRAWARPAGVVWGRWWLWAVTRSSRKLRAVPTAPWVPGIPNVRGGVVLLPGHLFSFFGVCGLRQKFMAEVDLLYNPCSALRLRSVCLLSPRTNTCSKLPERPG